jgi:D-beta-D-heptose 7-phosphate kinase/D-beta-D-heptose 1-phosphate adenosyltransferase
MEKIKSPAELDETLKNLKKQGKKIVWTNGCFDLLHEGHIKYLKKSKEQGDFLVVGLNSDSSIKRLKGSNRPIMPERARAEILASLEFVDFIMIFDEDSPCKHLSILKPDVYVKGGDYTLDTINQIERKIVDSYGGKIFITGLVEGISTSKIIEKMKNDTIN